MSKVVRKTILATISAAFFLGSLAHADHWEPASCPKDVKPVARELIELQLSGGSLSEATSCIDQRKFKYIFARNEGSDEQDNQPDIVLHVGDTYQIDQVSARNNLGEWNVNFSVRAHTSGGPRYFQRQFGDGR